MKIKIYPESSGSEMDCETVHNHMDCPACGEKRAPTKSYHDIWEEVMPWEWGGNQGTTYILTCGACGAKFHPVDFSPDELNDWEWEQIQE